MNMLNALATGTVIFAHTALPSFACESEISIGRYEEFSGTELHVRHSYFPDSGAPKAFFEVDYEILTDSGMWYREHTNFVANSGRYTKVILQVGVKVENLAVTNVECSDLTLEQAFCIEFGC